MLQRTTTGPAPLLPPPQTLERAVLLTVLYADLFDYPLTEDELYRRLIAHPADRAAVAQALADLTGPFLARREGFVTWTGRTGLVDVRRRRTRAAEHQWPTARRYADWLARVPFVQMVAVSGSLAVDNAEPDGDVDVFCVTTPARLWVARLFIVPLSKLTRRFPGRFPAYLCPNYLLTLDALTLEDRTLFTAHETVQTRLVWGADAYARFLRSNPWVADFLPHHRPAPPIVPASDPARPRLTRWTERLLKGRLGDGLDRTVHRLFLTFYRRRAERRGWAWAPIARAYRRDRYTVPEGGYQRVVRARFAERVHSRLGVDPTAAELDRLFGAAPDRRGAYDWEARFARDYGLDARPASSTAA